ncbi:MAG: acyltransferase, partial [Thiohalocapsa sp.]|nr:acyltransferase [Thiohalocapsa sp.]
MPKRDTIKTACVQIRHRAAAGANRGAIERQLREAAAQGCRLALLPELHEGPYFCQREEARLFDAAEPVPGPTTQWLGALAGTLGMVIVGSVFERRAAGVYHNTAVVLDADGSLAG